MAAATKMRTMYLFFAENSMIFSIMFIASRRGLDHPAEGGLEARLGVDEEVGGHDDVLAVAKPVEDLEHVLALDAELHLPGPEIPVAPGHEDDLGYAGVQDCVGGDGQFRPIIDMDLEVGEHLGLELEPRIGDLDADLVRPRLGLEIRIDVDDLPGERFPGIIGKGDLRLLPGLDEGQLVLVDFAEDPD